MPLKQHVSSGA